MSKKIRFCHSERSEESGIHAVNGFFVTLRFAQNDTFEIVLELIEIIKGRLGNW
jgi:hypothetical protein